MAINSGIKNSFNFSLQSDNKFLTSISSEKGTGKSYGAATLNGGTDTTYIIKSGDTLSEIAQANNTTVEELAVTNNIKDPNKIYAGDSITINSNVVTNTVSQPEVQEEVVVEAQKPETVDAFSQFVDGKTFRNNVSEKEEIIDSTVEADTINDVEKSINIDAVKITPFVDFQAPQDFFATSLNNNNHEKIETSTIPVDSIVGDFKNYGNSKVFNRPKPNVIKISDVNVDNTLTKRLDSVLNIKNLFANNNNLSIKLMEQKLSNLEKLLTYQVLMEEDVYKTFAEINKDSIDEKIHTLLQNVSLSSNFKGIESDLTKMTEAQKLMLAYLLENYSEKDAADFYDCIQFSIKNVTNVQEVEKLLNQVKLNDNQQVNDLLLNVFNDGWLGNVFDLRLTAEEKTQKNIDKFLNTITKKIKDGTELSDKDYQKLILLQYLKDTKGDKLSVRFDNVLYDDVVRDIVNPIVKNYQLVASEDSVINSYEVNGSLGFDNNNLLYDNSVYADVMKNVLMSATTETIEALSQYFTNISKTYLQSMQEILSSGDINVMSFEKGFYDGRKGDNVSINGFDKKSYAAGLLMNGLTEQGNNTLSYQNGEKKIDLSKIIDKYSKDKNKDLAKAYSQVQFNDSFIEWLVKVANDNKHGYSQASRTGSPDYDCSSLIYYGLLANGYTKSQIGALPFTTYTEKGILQTTGDFEVLKYTSSKDLQPGDILWRNGHTEVYVGDGKRVGAHKNYDSRPGDSGGQEINVKNMDSNWISIIRHKS